VEGWGRRCGLGRVIDTAVTRDLLPVKTRSVRAPVAFNCRRLCRHVARRREISSRSARERDNKRLSMASRARADITIAARGARRLFVGSTWRATIMYIYCNVCRDVFAAD